MREDIVEPGEDAVRIAVWADRVAQGVRGGGIETVA